MRSTGHHQLYGHGLQCLRNEQPACLWVAIAGMEAVEKAAFALRSGLDEILMDSVRARKAEQAPWRV